jgi:hypothetical protein
VRITFKCADFVIAISCEKTADLFRLNGSYKDFLSHDDPEVTVLAHYNGLPNISLRDTEKIFDSETVWSLYSIGSQRVFVLKPLLSDPVPSRIAIFSEDFWQGEIYSHISEDRQLPDGLLPNPLEFPLSEIWMVSLFSKGHGLMVHACGIDDNGRGYLFAGNSTHGKTTIAKIWKEQAVILNDDRIVIRKRDGQFWIYGTPWHGEYTGVSSKGVPVKKIFFLHHADRNSMKKCSGIDAASMLLVRSFPPLWDSEGMKFTLDFCSKLVSAVPCYKLNFMPDEDIVDFVRCMK